jgi:hypothetical protein
MSGADVRDGAVARGRAVRDDALDRAIVEVTGFGRSTFPHRVLDGVDARLEPRIRDVLATLDSFTPDWDGIDLVEATRKARAHVAAGHPDLGDDALDALAWLYSFEMR